MGASEVNRYFSQFPENTTTRKEAELRVALGRSLMNRAKEARTARKIMNDIVYITVATVNNDGTPWNSPVFCAYDSKYNFYWISSKNCVHSANIEQNHNVALVIYDSTVPEGEGVGVYVKAKADIVTNRREMEKALGLIYKRKRQKAPPDLDEFIDSPRAVYKAKPVTFWVNDLGRKGVPRRYLRLEVRIK